jgi:hypothetical protein
VNPTDSVSIGNGGVGGSGGNASVLISNLLIDGGTGNDRITVVSKAVGGDGGDANGGNGNVVKGLSGIASTGARASGYDVTAQIDGVTVNGGSGNDQISISLSANLSTTSKSAGALAAMGTATLMMVDSVFSGGDGNDTFALSSFSNMSSTIHRVWGNKFDGGAGTDALDMRSWSSGVTVDLGKSALSLAANVSNTVDNIETFIGTKYKDTFVFSDDSSGTAVTGGGGSDKFTLTAAALHEKNSVKDFSARDGDQLVIDAFSFGSEFGKGSSPSVDIGDLGAPGKARGSGSFIYDNVGSDAGTLYYDATGGGAEDAVSLIVLANRPTLTMADLLFV